MKSFRLHVIIMLIAMSPSLFALTAGSAKFDITTSEAQLPWRGHVDFTGIHDRLYARALVLKENGKQAAIVSLDEGIVPKPEETLRMLSEASGIPQSHIILCATHTHSVPLSNLFGKPDEGMEREIRHIQLGAVTALRSALDSMRDASLSFARTQTFVNTNNGELAGSGNGTDPTGTSDHTLDIVKVTAKDGKPLAILLNFPSHAEVMFKSVTLDGGTEITGDLPGAVSRYLEETAKAAPVVLCTCGAEGDQLPLFKSRQKTRYFGDVDYGKGGWTLLDILARRVAEAVMDGIEKMSAVSAIPLRAASATASVPGQKINFDYAKDRVISIEKRPDISIPVSVILLGDRENGLAFWAVGGDVAAGIGMRLRDASPCRRTVLITVSAGSIGYILEDESYANPGHNAAGSPVRPGYAEKALKDAFLSLTTDTK